MDRYEYIGAAEIPGDEVVGTFTITDDTLIVDFTVPATGEDTERVVGGVEIPFGDLADLARKYLRGETTHHDTVLHKAAQAGAAVAAVNPDPDKAVKATLAAIPEKYRNDARISVHRPSASHQEAKVVVFIDWIGTFTATSITE